MELPRIHGNDDAVWFVVIRPNARLWSFRLSGGMSTAAFVRTLAPPEEPGAN